MQKKYWSILVIMLFLFLLNACISRMKVESGDYQKREAQIIKIDAKLSEEYYKLLEDPILENKRKSLEQKYQDFYKNLNSLEVKNNPEHLKFLIRYRKKVKTQLQYLQDLKGEA